MKQIFLAFTLFNVILSTTLSSRSHSGSTLKIIAIVTAGALLAWIQLAIPNLEGSRHPYGPLLIPSWLLYIRTIHLVVRPKLYHVLAEKKGDEDLHLGWSRKIATPLLNLWGFRTFPRMVKNVPAFSDTDKSYVPSRSKFLAVEAAKFVTSWLVFELSYAAPPPNVEAAFTARHEKTLFRLGKITGEEAATRVFTVAFTWIGTWALVTGFYSASALFFAGCNLSSPSAWLPIFGSLREAYTIRRFWGIMWHQTFRMPLEESSKFIVSRILRIPKGSLISRYSELMFAFGLSGLVHMLSDIAIGLPAHESGAPIFFTIQALGIIFEDTVQALYRRSGFQGLWTRWVGYVWVILFFLWSTPGWTYPNVRFQRPGVDVILPYRFLS